ncbi:MAG: hypothetical protein ACFWUJ_12205 [Pseudomonas fragi]|jgi:hypothetical protein
MPNTPDPSRQPHPFKVSRWTVQRKLVLAFWLVSVIPTMIAAELAATTLSQIFDSNVRVWLQESTKIVKDEISETLADNARAAKLFLQYTHPPSSSKAVRHDRLSTDIADAMGIDVVALIRDSDHKVVYSTVSDNIVGQISPSALQAMARYHWPGNIRELQNCVERAIIVATSSTIQDSDLPPYLFSAQPGQGSALLAPGPGVPPDLEAALAEVEKAYILSALQQANGVQAAAAQLIGISERSFWYRLKKLDIHVDKIVR